MSSQQLKCRKIVRHVEEIRLENGRVVDPPLRIAIVAAVIENPFPLDYVQDLVTLADAVGEELGLLIGPECVALLGEDVEAFGKGALIGVDGELEHGSALIHNLRFGNVFRNAAGGTELLPAVEKVGLQGSPMQIPLKHKLDSKTRSHHQTTTLIVDDAPRRGEIMVAVAAANTGRPLARLATFGAEVK
jgi:hypothetical protein